MRRYPLLLAVLSLGFAPAPAPKPDNSKADLKKMQGTWVYTCVEHGHGTCPVAQERMVIAGDRLTYTRPEGRSEWVVNLDATKSRKAITLRGIGGDARRQVRRGTYRLDGDTLRISVSPVGLSPLGDVDITLTGPSWDVWERVRR